MGRPTKYKPEHCEELITFFSIEPYREREIKHIKWVRDKKEEWSTFEDVPNDVPFFLSFARKIEVSRESLHEWVKKYPEFSVAYNTAKGLQKRFLVQNALKGFYPPASFIFTAKNITDMRDKTEVEHSGEVNVMGTITVNGEAFKPDVGD